MRAFARLCVLSCALVACAAASRQPPRVACMTNGDCDAAAAQCDRGDANACLTLGYLYGTATHDSERFHRPDLGEAYLARACRLEVLACSGLVDVAEIRGDECRKDYAARIRMLTLACDQRYPPGCALLAMAYVDGVDVARDMEKAAWLSAEACDADDRFHDFFETRDDGTPVPHEDPMRLQVLACVAREAIGKLGLALPPVRTTPEEALRLDGERRRRWSETRRFVPDRSPPDYVARLREDLGKEIAQPAPERLTAAQRGRSVSGGLCSPPM